MSSKGRIELTGPIDKVIIGGQETLFDSITASTSLDPQAGDFDFDGDVDGRDFLVWQRDPNIGDLVDWQMNYGVETLAESMSVPEPSSTWLLAAVVPWWRGRYQPKFLALRQEPVCG